jgi:dolichyl-phosphate beta-glucosyltransferase
VTHAEHARSTPPVPALVGSSRSTTAAYLSIVVPVRNGAARLTRTLHELHQLLGSQPYASELIVVDDCSGDDVARAVESFRALRPVKVLRNERNRGKGYSVARGMLEAEGDVRLFTDADLAYAREDIETIVEALERGSDVAIACRVLNESRFLMSPAFFPYLFTRHVMSRAFNAVVRALLVDEMLDTQAGLKGFTRRAAELVFPRLTVARFGFDVECLYIAHQHHLCVAQVPVTFRYDDEPSTVNVLRDGARMLADLGRIRLNAWRGNYR